MVWSGCGFEISSSRVRCALDSAGRSPCPRRRRRNSAPGMLCQSHPVRPGAMSDAEKEVGKVSAGLHSDVERADAVGAGRDIVRHFRNGTGELTRSSPEDVGHAHHGRTSHTGEPQELPPRQRPFHRDLFRFCSRPYHTGGIGCAYSFQVRVNATTEPSFANVAPPGTGFPLARE